MTGAQFWSYLQQKLDKAYSAYLDTTKANALVAETMQRLVDKYWRKESLEVDADEMMPFLVKAANVVPTSGIVNIGTQLPNYMHVMYMEVVYNIPFTVTNVSGTTLTSALHTLKVGDTVFYNVSTYTVKKVKGNTFDLGTLGLSPGTYEKVITKPANQWQSDRKGNAFHKASMATPRFEPQNDITGGAPKSIKISPSTDLKSVNIDYVRTPPFTINTTDTSTQLETYYSSKFLYRLMDECVMNFAGQTKDPMTRQMAAQDIIDNP